MVLEERDSSSTSSLPVVSLDENEEVIIQQLRQVCVKHGFFYVTNHGVPSSLLIAALEQSKAFFSRLSLEEKRALSDPELSRGYTGMQEETLDPEHQSEGDTKEGFYIARDVPKDHVDYNPSKLKGPNQWPDPQMLPEFRSVMEEYYQRMCELGFRLVQLLALSLELPSRHFFDEAFRDDPMAALRLLHYDGHKASDPSQGVFACGAHSDYGMLTLLLTDEHAGLQVWNQSSQTWMDVAPIPNGFIVNLGDMLERWTNGLYRSTIHRVVTTTALSALEDRYSIPFFYEPAFDTVVECLPTCCNDTDNPTKYPPITSGQHLLDKYKQTHADFTPHQS